MKDAGIFCRICKSAGLPEPVAEYRFAPPRRFRFDYAWPLQKVAIEIEGGIWVRGRHTRGAGYESDLEKYNIAVLLAWKVLRFTPMQIREMAHIKFLRMMLTPLFGKLGK